MNRVFHGTSVAVLTYIGFDGISTLSEEVDNPKRNIFLATVLVCVITGFLAAAEVYGAQLLSSVYNFPESEVENAFSHVSAIAGGPLLAKAISVTLLIATVGSGMGAQLGAARLLYGMGRSDAIPKKFFGAIHPRTRIPANNVIFVGMIALIGAFLVTYDNGAQLLNFGALIAFMGVNLASLTHYFIRGESRASAISSRPFWVSQFASLFGFTSRTSPSSSVRSGWSVELLTAPGRRAASGKTW